MYSLKKYVNFKNTNFKHPSVAKWSSHVKKLTSLTFLICAKIGSLAIMVTVHVVPDRRRMCDIKYSLCSKSKISIQPSTSVVCLSACLSGVLSGGEDGRCRVSTAQPCSSAWRRSSSLRWNAIDFQVQSRNMWEQ